MKKIALIIAIIAGKLVSCLSRIVGTGGTSLPGKIALKLYPQILNHLSANISEEIFVVTGTNGKTTTTNMLAGILKQKGYTFVHNRAGANMITGITTAFIRATNWTGKRQIDYALLETDEANVPLLLQQLHPRIVLITNFFSDQLDRYGELETIINLIKDAVRDTDIELVLNADDPLVTHFKNDTGLHCWYYGFDDTKYDRVLSEEGREGRFCVFCGQELYYQRFHYAQLGKFSCPECGNKNPERNFTAYSLNLTPKIEMKVNDIEISSPYQGFYNAYNILAAVSLAKLAGIEDEIIQKAIAHLKPRAGRMEQFNIDNRIVTLILVKNSTGLNQALSAINTEPGRKTLFLALNDNVADGRDISWIWDADIEQMTNLNSNLEAIVCSGLRSGDMALRFKYADAPVDLIYIEDELQSGVKRALSMATDRAYLLSTYTALFVCRDILLKLQQESVASTDRFGEKQNSSESQG
ncbi:MAG: MurT ligase domain-containing protein [Syntrophomonadaceae bacterium]|jgi:UDP-N-acetylmuramyl tripeptide synthase